ncbi:MAG: deoxyribose-phosphate aldolase [Gemmatimonadaceae bacterium]
MTVDLGALAQRVAGELARADAMLPIATRPIAAMDRGPASPTALAVASPPTPAPRGVSFVRDQARIADFIDHTLLKPEATRRDVERLCAEARDNRFAAVCVNPVWVPLCHELLAGSGVKVATVIGFPLGANQPEGKAAEAALAVRQGADECDMVAALGHIKSADWRHVARDIEAVVTAASGALVKVIIESALLSPLEVVKASALAREAGAHYVKTSTGFNAAGGATAEAVTLMRLAVGDALGVKASGGVRDCDAALKMIAAGATRIGTSSGVGMVQCLGSGPLPLRDLLAAPQNHAVRCSTGSCAPAPSGTTSNY